MIGDALFLVPDSWEQLSLPETARRSLKIAVEALPYFLSSTATALDDEVTDFTQNGGWHKIDSLSPLVFRVTDHWTSGELANWIGTLRQFLDNVKVGDFPLLGAAIDIVSLLV